MEMRFGMAAGTIRIKRAYEACKEEDGYRILVDRLWPRGIKKERLACPYWAKDISPSQGLRKQFHGTDDFPGFTAAYGEELDCNPAAPDFAALCMEKLHEGNVTLVYASKDEEHNNAVVLRQWLKTAGNYGA